MESGICVGVHYGLQKIRENGKKWSRATSSGILYKTWNSSRSRTKLIHNYSFCIFYLLQIAIPFGSDFFFNTGYLLTLIISSETMDLSQTWLQKYNGPKQDNSAFFKWSRFEIQIAEYCIQFPQQYQKSVLACQVCEFEVCSSLNSTQLMQK